MDDSVSSAELAEILGVSERQIRSLVEKDVLTAHKNAKGHYRFDPSTAKDEFELYEMTLGRGLHAKASTKQAHTRKTVSAEYAEDGYRWAAETWWVARKELLAYPGRVLTRLFNNDGGLHVSDLDSIRSILEDEACECMNEIESYDKEDSFFQLQDSCPYSGMANDYECACAGENGGCYMTREAFSACLVSPQMLEIRGYEQSTHD